MPAGREARILLDILLRPKQRILVAAAIATISLCETARPDVVNTTWIGPSGQSWHNPANWSAGVIPTNGADLYNVFIDGGSTLSSSVVLNNSATIANLTIDAGDQLTIASSHLLGFYPAASIAGGGTINLAGGWIFGYDVSNNTTIRGTGGISANFANHHVVSADVSGGGLSLQGPINTGTLQAINGGTMTILAGSMLNNSGTIEARDGSTISINGTIVGGTFTTSGSGVIEMSSGLACTISDVHNAGHLIIQPFAYATLMGLINNAGSITLNAGTQTASIYSYPSPTLNFSGGGTINLVGSVSETRISTENTVTSDNYIHGSGSLQFGTFNSSGALIADVGGGGILMQSIGGFLNSGSIAAINGGTFQMWYTPLVNHGTVLVGAGSSMTLINNFYGAIDSTAGAIRVESGGTLRLIGPQSMNTGSIELNGLLSIGTYNGQGGTYSFGQIVGSGSISQTHGVATARKLDLSGITMLSGGTFSIESGGGTLGTSRVKNLPSINGNAKFNLNDHDLIIDHDGGPLAPKLRERLKNAYANGAWTGYGITSVLAGASAAPTKTALGYHDNSDGAFTQFSGLDVDTTSLLVKYTYVGDATLDGVVDISDLYAVASNWRLPGYWDEGDFNYDSQVNGADLALLATNWQAGVGSPLGADLNQALISLGFPIQAVPEPALLGVGTFLGAASRRRRRI